MALLREKLKPLPDDDPKGIAKLIGELDHDQGTVRERAAAELTRRGELAGSQLRRLLAAVC